MEDDDDLLDDDFFTENILDALDKQESQYFNTQQLRRQNEWPESSVVLPGSDDHSLSMQAISASVPITPIVVRDFPQDQINAAWETTSMDNGRRLQETDQLIEGLQFTIERLQRRVTQDEAARDNAQREMDRYRTELNFKNQELESARRELKSLKSRNRQADESQQSMNVDELSQSQSSTSKKRSLFPSAASFTAKKIKRPTLIRHATPAGPSRPAQPTPTDSASELSTPTTPSLTAVSPEPKRPSPPVEDTQAKQQFYLHLLSREYYAWQSDNNRGAMDPIMNLTPSLVSYLSRRMSHRLIPLHCVNEADKKLAMLASDISDCIIQSANTDLKTTIQRLLYMLGLCLSISCKEKMLATLIRTIDIVHTLTIHYREAPRYLVQDLSRAEETSTLWNLALASALFPATTIDAVPDRIKVLKSLPDTSNMSFQEISTLLEMYHVTAQELCDTTRSKLHQEESVESICKILDIFIHSAQAQDKAALAKFILRQDTLIHFMSITRPLPVISKTLMLMNIIVAEQWPSESLLGEFSRVSRLLTELLAIPKPNRALEKEWYNVRTLTLSVWGAIVSSRPVDALLKPLYEEFFPSLIYLLKNECLRIRNSSNPPYEPVSLSKSEQLIVDGVTLIHRVVNAYPAILRLQEGELYDVVVDTLNFASSISLEEWGENHQVQVLFRKIGRLLRAFQKQTPSHV